MNGTTKSYKPTEVIFSVTEACNLQCPHCFVSKSPKKLDSNSAIEFLKELKNNAPEINKIGFSGGEPFLNLDFLLEVTKFAVSNDFMFDQIATNGDWWKNQEDLTEKISKLYDSGYDGKFCLSWDYFHGQSEQRILTFIKTIKKIFGEDSINIQTVLPPKTSKSLFIQDKLYKTHSKMLKKIKATIKKYYPEIKIYVLPQSFQSNHQQAWNNKKWFIEDYCQGPGNIFFVHPSGDISPCCGFANENKKLIIGHISDSYKKLMENANENFMIKTCYETGLLQYKNNLEAKGEKLPGITSDICTFCDYVCNNR